MLKEKKLKEFGKMEKEKDGLMITNLNKMPDYFSL